MAQLIWLVALLAAHSAFAKAALEPLGLATFPPKKTIDGAKVGGLSALAFDGGKLWMLSDDRGKFAPPRVFTGALTVEPKIEWTIAESHELKNIPDVKKLTRTLDPEGFVRLPSGEWLVTSEADTDRKPRESNRLMKFTSDGKYVADFDFPSEIQPEKTGRQTKGTMNNFGPEGLSICPDGSLWTAIERPLVQAKDSAVRFDRWEQKDGVFTAKDVRFYEPERPVSSENELLRGVSDILCLPDGKLLVLERSATITAKGLGFGGGIFTADCAKDKCVKSEVLHFGRDLAKLRDHKPVANFEGLAFGPVLKDGRKTVLMISDDNFSGSSGSELVVMTLKETAP